MGQTDLAGVDEHGCVDFIFGADDDVDIGQHRTNRHPERPWIMPLVRTEIDIEYYLCTCLLGKFGSKNGCRSTGILAQIGASKLKHLAFPNWGGQHIIDGQFDISTIVAVIDQRKLVRWFYPQCYRT